MTSFGRFQPSHNRISVPNTISFDTEEGSSDWLTNTFSLNKAESTGFLQSLEVKSTSKPSDESTANQQMTDRASTGVQSPVVKLPRSDPPIPPSSTLNSRAPKASSGAGDSTSQPSPATVTMTPQSSFGNNFTPSTSFASAQVTPQPRIFTAGTFSPVSTSDYRIALGLKPIVPNMIVKFNFLERFQPSKTFPEFKIDHIPALEIVFSEDDNEQDLIKVARFHAMRYIKLMGFMTTEGLVFDVSLDYKGITIPFGQRAMKLSYYTEFGERNCFVKDTVCRVVISYKD